MEGVYIILFLSIFKQKICESNFLDFLSLFFDSEFKSFLIPQNLL